MRKEIMFGIVGVVIGVIGVFLLSLNSEYSSMMFGRGNSINQENSIPNRNIRMMNNIDKHFIEQMIPHHEGAVDMAELALLKATHPEIKNLALAIIEAQNKEIEDMRSWNKLWYKKDVADGIAFMVGDMMSQRGMHMGGQKDIQTLENAVDFDKAFIEGMIPHHQLAIMMAQMLKSGTNRPEMLTLANNIIESQTKEIKDMQIWYESWY